MLPKGKKAYAALIGLEKFFDRIEENAVWDVLKVYGVVGKLLSGVMSCYKGVDAYVVEMRKVEGCR